MTEVLLRGLSELRPVGRWTLWGPPAIEEHAWPEADVAVTSQRPLAGAAQREAFQVPPARLAFFPHAVRPLTFWRPSAVLIQDLIPIHHDPSRLRRLLWKGFFSASVRSARHVLANSEATASRVVTELGVPAERIRVVPLTVDTELTKRIRLRRTSNATADAGMLYVGQVKPHKNLERALLAFKASRFASAGGRFTLVGASSSGETELRELVERHGVAAVDVVRRCSDIELERLYAQAALVIQPSLDEGFGLPVLEALSAGIPVCCSNVPPLVEASRGFAELFDPGSVASMAEAIDRAAALAGSDEWRRRDQEFLASCQLPTAKEFAARIVSAVRLEGGVP